MGVDGVARDLVAVVFEGGAARGPIESWVAKVREDMAVSTCRRLHSIGRFSQVTLVTDRIRLAERARTEAGAVPYLSDASHFPGSEGGSQRFHFGRLLKEVLSSIAGGGGAPGFVYMSGGAGYLMTQDEILSFAEKAAANPDAVVANNVYSADMFAAADAGLLLGVDLPDADNAAPLAAQAAGARVIGLPQTVGTTFDVDTPSDLLVLAAAAKLRGSVSSGSGAVASTGGYGDRLAQIVGLIRSGPIDIAMDRLERAYQVVEGHLPEIAIIGRVSPSTVLELNSRLTARLRVFSEERGMRSFGRDVPGGAKSLIGRFVDAVGPRAFFDHLSWCADAAFIDTRVLFSHMNAALTQEERFASDLCLAERIENRAVAEFVDAARDASIPVVLGGHSLVSGGLRVLAEAFALCPYIGR